MLHIHAHMGMYKARILNAEDIDLQTASLTFLGVNEDRKAKTRATILRAVSSFAQSYCVVRKHHGL
jgi:hypothetical protein